MSNEVVTVHLDETLNVIKKIFEEQSFHHILVVDSRKLVGVISDRDLLKTLSPNIDTIAATTKELAALNKRAHQIMSRNLVVLTEDSTVKDAILLFNQNSVSCLPVISSDNRVLGILTWRDIMRALGQKYQS